MSNLNNISITHTFNGDTSASGMVNTGDLDTQLGNLATAQNETKQALDTITDGANNLAAQTVGLAQLKPEVLVQDGMLSAFPDHNSLENMQGGNGNERYHLTAAQYTSLITLLALMLAFGAINLLVYRVETSNETLTTISATVITLPSYTVV